VFCRGTLAEPCEWPTGALFAGRCAQENVEAAEAAAGEVLKQALSLRRRARKLHRELQLAELALGKDSSESDLGRLKDFQAQLPALGGIEAGAEGLGAQSVRPSGTL
jgi:hypothetical protein